MITHQYVKEILNTLPIGYYLGTRAEVTYEENGGSYCNPMDNTIHISGSNVLDALKNMKSMSPEDTESTVRAILYHEVSHLILTPKINHITPHFNIFEDERIETILAHFYEGVDFKRNIIMMNGWNPSIQPKNAQDFFYNICRFRHGPKQFTNKVGKIIRRYHHINASTSEYQYEDYIDAVNNFWDEVRKYWNQNNQNQQNNQQQNQENNQNQQNQKNNQNQQGQQGQQNQSGSNSSSGSQSKKGQNQQNQQSSGNGKTNESNSQNSKDQKSSGNGRGKQDSNDAGDDQQNGQNSSSGNQQNESGEQEDDSNNQNGTGKDSNTNESDEENEGNSSSGKSGEEDSDGEENEGAAGSEDDSGEDGPSEDEIKKAIQEAIEKAIGDATKEMDKQEQNTIKMDRAAVSKLTDKLLRLFQDNEMIASLQRIIIRNNKKKAMRSPYSIGYAGKVDPHSVARRQDYRWFVHKGDSGSNKFNRTHITLWVDTSGSFSSSIDEVNKLIFALAEMERQLGREFSFDVVSMDEENKICSAKKALTVYGCNHFGPGVVEIAHKLNKSGYENYNIIVWDGDLESDVYNGVEEANRWAQAFRALDTNHTVITSDSYNSRYLDKHMKKARIKYIDRDYVKVFIKEVISLLDRAMAC